MSKFKQVLEDKFNLPTENFNSDSIDFNKPDLPLKLQLIYNDTKKRYKGKKKLKTRK